MAPSARRHPARSPKSGLQDLRDETQRLRWRLVLLTDLSCRVCSSLDLPVVLQDAVAAACELAAAKYGMLALFDSAGRAQLVASHGLASGSASVKGEGLERWLRPLQQPIRVADLTKRRELAGLPQGLPPMKTLLALPILYGEQTLGALYLLEKAEGAQFSQEDEDLLALFAAQAANAVRHAKLVTAMTEGDKRLRDILDNTSAVIYIKDAEGRYILINRRYEALFHVTNAQVRGQSDHDLFPKEQADVLRANDQSVLKSGTTLEFEEAVYQDDGPRTYFSVKFPLFDDAGTPNAVCGISTDITARKRTEEALQEEQRRLRALLETSPVGIIAIQGRERQTVLTNKELERILGFPIGADQSLDRFEDAVTFSHTDGTEYTREERPLERALLKGETVRSEEVVLRFPDGRRLLTLVSATPVRAASGELSGAIAIVQDISPLEEVERLRSEFLGMVSHELKTPLTAIKGSAATALGTTRPLDHEESQELFKIIDEQSDRLRDLVDNILDMSRIEAGALSVTPEPLGLAALVQEASDNFFRSGDPHTVQVQVPDGLHQVAADRRRIVQVLTNLLSNAAKFSPATEPIAIEAQAGAGQVTVRIKDRGRGIPSEKMPQLFQKFSRLHEGSGQHIAGSGLGLAICKGIVEAHGGRIWAESPGAGQGTTFCFTLPFATAAQARPKSDLARRAQHLGRVRRPGERTRILAADDDPEVLRYLQRTLNEAGYQPVVTSDPGQVNHLVEQEEPDLVLLDLRFPGVSGFDVLQRLRELSGVPVIFLTASSQGEDTVRALKLGADDYMTKPFAPSELLARIEAALRRRVLPDQLEVRPPFALGDLSVDFAARRVTLGERPVALSATEYKLLYELATNAGRVLTHDQLLKRVWGQQYAGETELLRSFIRNLRRKLGDNAQSPRYVLTEPQVGYRMPLP